MNLEKLKFEAIVLFGSLKETKEEDPGYPDPKDLEKMFRKVVGIDFKQIGSKSDGPDVKVYFEPGYDEKTEEATSPSLKQQKDFEKLVKAKYAKAKFDWQSEEVNIFT